MRRKFIHIFAITLLSLCWVGSQAYAQEQIEGLPVSSQTTKSWRSVLADWYAAMDGSDGIVDLFSDQISYLRADHAILGGTGLSLRFIENEELKGSYVRNWTNSTQSFRWRVRSAVEENYHIDVLMQARTGIEIEVQAGGNVSSHSFTGDGWGRYAIGSVSIPAGTSTLTLRSSDSFAEMQLKALELKPASAKAEIDQAITDGRSTSDWIKGKTGVMFQWGEWGGNADGSASAFPQVYADFDFNAFAEKISDMGADYVIWSPAWWRYWMPAPISAIDRIQKGLTSQHDYLQDLIDALKAKNIKLMLYYHSGHAAHHDAHNRVWWSHFWKAPRAGHYARKEGAIDRWMQITAEIGLRYGKDLAGWFFDDGSQYYPAPFHLVNKALRAGNPDRYIAFNEWVDAQGPVITDYVDMSFGNGLGDGTSMNGLIDASTGKFSSGVWKGCYAHFMQTANDGWGILAPRTDSIRTIVKKADFKTQMTKAKSLNKPLSYAFLMWANGDMSRVAVDGFTRAKKP